MGAVSPNKHTHPCLRQRAVSCTSCFFKYFPLGSFSMNAKQAKCPHDFPSPKKLALNLDITTQKAFPSPDIFRPEIHSASGFRSLPLPFPLIRSIAHKHFWHGEKGLFQTPISPTQFSWGQFTPFQGGSQSSLPPSSLYHYAFLIGSPDREKAPVFPIPFSRSPSPLPRILMRIQKSDGGRELFKRSDG